MTIEMFYRETDAIDWAVEALRACILSSGTAAELSACLADLSTRLADLFEHENARIHGPIEDALPEASADALTMIADARQLHADCDAYLSDWTADCIEADRDIFLLETEALLDRIQRAANRAGNDLYPMALAKGLIRLRA